MRSLICVNLLAAGLLISLNLRAEPVPGPSESASLAPAPSSGDQVSAQLKTMLTDAIVKIGELEVWQKKIVEDEVIPQYQRFIRDYRQTGNRVSGVADLEILQNYLRFYAPKTLKFQNKKVLTILKVDTACTKCTASTPGIRDLVKNRLQRRGLVPVWLNDEEVSGFKGKALNDRVTELAKTKGLAGALVMQWGQVISDDIDDIHGEDKNYFTQSYLFLRDMEKQEGKLDLLENDRFETAVARLLTDSFSSLGAKLFQAAQMARMTTRKEVMLEISGFKDFQHYLKIRELLGMYFKNVGSIDE
ncbi:MAG TPA: hypothetical protein DCS07_07430, partial [Bdellovibrionales bacterium]|nr:hypothetical protein [Bdellovibrionales bacterium]